jgi:hypothetical protein
LSARTAGQARNEQWPLRIDIGGGHVAGKLQLQPGKGGTQVLQGQLNTEGVEVSALTAPSKPLTGKLQAQTTLRAEYREPGQLGDVLTDADPLHRARRAGDGHRPGEGGETVGLSRGGRRAWTRWRARWRRRARRSADQPGGHSGRLSANGNVSISASKALSGRIMSTSTRGALGVPLAVGGTVDNPSVTLTRGAMVGAALGTLLAPGIGTGAGCQQRATPGREAARLFAEVARSSYMVTARQTMAAASCFSTMAES